MKLRTFLLFIFISVLSLPMHTIAKEYNDGHGGKVDFPAGDVSFADNIHDFFKGEKPATPEHRNTKALLGIPDFKSSDYNTYLSLGCGGSVIASFDDNALIDIAGPDLYVFEIGPAVEPTALEISKDKQEWILIGIISGGKAEVDISPYISKGKVFRYVRLTDMKSDCGGKTPGADIDAVGAIGSGFKMSLNSSVLFDSGKYELKSATNAELGRILDYITQNGIERVIVEGHTDNVGSDGDNMELSRKRSESIRDYLYYKNQDVTIETQHYGESQPIASNDTEEGRQRNRRVDIVLFKNNKETSENHKPKKIIGIWDMGEKGIVQMVESNGNIRAHYKTDNGLILGKFTDKTAFEGYWVEDASNKKCKTPKDGRFHWGRLIFTYDDENLTSFTGKWGYCDAEPRSSGFAGKLLIGPSHIPPIK